MPFKLEISLRFGGVSAGPDGRLRLGQGLSGGAGSKLERAIRSLEKMPEKRASAIDRIIKSGIRENFTTLSEGGSVETWSSGPLAWTEHRHPVTAKIRTNLGLGRVEPMLSLAETIGEGPLARGLFGGTYRGGVRTIRYAPGEAGELIRVHQLGLGLLPTTRAGKPIPKPLRGERAPPRPVLFWSRKMVLGIIREAKAAAREAGR